MRVETERTIEFPNLIRESTLELPAIALSAIAAGIVLPWSRVLGLLLFIPLALWGANSVWTTIRNAITRLRWARSFRSTLNHRQLKALIQSDPQRYTLHVQYYGGFDALRLCPSAVIEDHQTGSLHAIYPPSFCAIVTCEASGIAIVS